MSQKNDYTHKQLFDADFYKDLTDQCVYDILWRKLKDNEELFAQFLRENSYLEHLNVLAYYFLAASENIYPDIANSYNLWNKLNELAQCGFKDSYKYLDYQLYELKNESLRKDAIRTIVLMSPNDAWRFFPKIMEEYSQIKPLTYMVHQLNPISLSMFDLFIDNIETFEHVFLWLEYSDLSDEEKAFIFNSIKQRVDSNSFYTKNYLVILKKVKQ